MSKKKCPVCKKLFSKNYTTSVKNWGKVKYCSFKCYNIVNPFKRKGKNHHSWKGDNINYHSIHDWLKFNFVKEKCENSICPGKSKNLNWCLIKGKKYERRRENFKVLCHSCHFKYDFTDIWRKRLSNSHKRYQAKKRLSTVVRP